MSALLLAAKVMATWLVVDLISGVVHWAEDSYGHPDLPFIGRRITKPNLLHHFRPRAFVTNSWFASSRLLIYACAASIAIAWAIGRLSPMVLVAAVLGANANQVHKWSHRSAAENGVLVTLAQRVGLLQSPAHHNRHHVGRKDSSYCVMTGLLNPLLDGCHVWRGLEWLLRVCGLPKRDDDALLAGVLAVEPDFLDRRA
ncbi:MAG: fatty acid desaturase CarF family protein [Vicinamibacterales bacterium]